MDTEFTFSGFSVPHYTQVPDELFDQLLAVLSGAELKVLLYIIRRTFGFKKPSDNISLSQITDGIVTISGRRIDSGTGLSKSTASLAVSGLVAKNVIIKVRNHTPRRGDTANTYRLNLCDVPSQRSSAPVSENRTPVGPEIGYGEGRKSDTQETVRQETVFQRVNVNAEEPARKEEPAVEPWKIADTVQQILEVTGDPKSTGFYRRVARLVPEELIYQALSETKVAKLGGEVRTSPGALFTSRVKDIARRNRIDLGLKATPRS